MTTHRPEKQHTVHPNKYAHGSVLLCFVLVMIKKRKLYRTKLQQNTRHVPRVISREILCCNEANKDVKINVFGKYNDESFLDKIIY